MGAAAGGVGGGGVMTGWPLGRVGRGGRARAFGVVSLGVRLGLRGCRQGRWQWGGLRL